MPTPIRKNGMNKAFPTNSIRFIRGEVFGIRRLSASPARNAPTMPSIPTTWAKKAPRKTMPRTKIYCETLSSKRLKNHRPITGKTNIMNKTNAEIDALSPNQNVCEISPVSNRTITARTNRASTVVINVPPILIVTALFLVIPNLLTIG